MHRKVSVICALILAVVATTAVAAESSSQPDSDPAAAEAKAEALPWVRYPASVDLASRAKVSLAKDLEYLGPSESAAFIQLNGNPPPTVATSIISKNNFRWFSVFSFDESGYVKDDEKIDADKLLKSLMDGNKASDDRRKELGLRPLTLAGWYVPPHYDSVTHRLEWGTKLLDENNNVTVNYTVRLLGRAGVMSATLISSPQNLDTDVAEFRQVLDRVNFNSGESYSEFRNGDKIAAYGLGALVLGGAAAVAVKSGAGLFKVIGVAIVAACAAVANFFRRIFGRVRNK